MFGRKKKQKNPRKKGCWSRWGSLFMSVFLMLVIGAIISITGLINGTQNVQKYLTLLEEIQKPVSESEMAPNKITAQDKLDFQDLFNDAIQHLDGLPLFDDSGNFISENFSDVDRLQILYDIELGGADIACLLNSLLGSGWIADLYKSDASLMDVLQVEISTSASGLTTLSAVAKIAIPELFAESSSDISEIKELLSDLPNYVYLSIESTFNFKADERVSSSTLHINRLSEESNELLLELLFEELDDEGGEISEPSKTVAEKLNEAMTLLLEQLDELDANFGCHVLFEGDYLVLSPL